MIRHDRGVPESQTWTNDWSNLLAMAEHWFVEGGCAGRDLFDLKRCGRRDIAWSLIGNPIWIG